MEIHYTKCHFPFSI
ncbi:hypothetical protein RJ641_004341 [Dillenia turbinata]|uniref:Uncharacterized protein n=1 Tax=Dillenia turbinata TaxID=194707 RepID=A0AAN8VIV6_9MAGN